MSNPQLEEGYTRIANELIEAVFRQELNGLQFRVLLLFIRQSYGYGKKEAPLSADYVQKRIGTGKRYAQKIIKSLIDNKILLVESEATFSKPRILSINKNWVEWDVIAPQRNDIDTEVQSGRTTEVQTGRTTEVQSDTHKRNNMKEKNKENIYEHFFENLWQNYPRKLGKGTVTKKAKKELYDAGMDVVTEAINKYRGETEHQEERFILYGSTFFNGRWKDYVTAPKQQSQCSVQEERVFDRFRNLPEEVFQDFRERGIISDEGGVCCGEATEEQILLLQKAGAL